MSNSLYGQKPKDTYQALIKVGDDTIVTTVLKPLSDGQGNTVAMEVSTNAVNFTGDLKDNGIDVPTAAEVAAKQDTLVSGTNIKTINGNTILGSGDLVISGASAVWGAITGTLSNQTDLQSALNAKVTANTSITAATKTKITYDDKGLVTAGNDATTADISDSSNKRYVTDAQLTVISNTSGTNTGDNATNSQYSGLATSKQDTLISGTNIKTINSSSILGSGDVVVQAVLVSGTNIKTINSSSILGSGNITVQDTLVSGTNIQSINGSSILTSGNLSLQPTLVSGTSIKTINSTDLLGSGDVTVQDTLVSGTNIKTINGSSILGAGNLSVSASPSGVAGAIQFSDGSALSSDATKLFWDNTNKRLGINTNTPSYPLHVKGTGATTATTSLFAENSTGTSSLTFNDGGALTIVSGTSTVGIINNAGSKFYNVASLGGFGSSRVELSSAMDLYDNNGVLGIRVNTAYTGIAQPSAIGQTTAPVSQALLELVSTTRGFLPPRMTTAQRDAITTPPDGLLLYNSTSKTFQYRINSNWEEFGSQTNARTTASAAINTTETILVSSPVLTANRFMASTYITIIFSGTNTSSVAGTSTFRVRIGTAGTTADTLVFTATTANSAASGTNIAFRGQIDITIRTVGATATAYGTLTLNNAGSTGISTVLTQVINGTMSSFDSTTANIVSLSYLSAATTTTSTFQQAIIEIND